MAKRPSADVEAQACTFRELSDDEIAELYTKDQLNPYPSMVIRDAIALVMKERNFTVKLTTSHEIVRG